MNTNSRRLYGKCFCFKLRIRENKVWTRLVNSWKFTFLGSKASYEKILFYVFYLFSRVQQPVDYLFPFASQIKIYSSNSQTRFFQTRRLARENVILHLRLTFSREITYCPVVSPLPELYNNIRLLNYSAFEFEDIKISFISIITPYQLHNQCYVFDSNRLDNHKERR